MQAGPTRAEHVDEWRGRAFLDELVAEATRAAGGSARDPLTGLAARPALVERLATVAAPMVGVTEGQPPDPVLVFVEVDRLREVNGRLGRDAGDALLRSAAERLQASSGPTDEVYRIGADEFVVLRSGTRPDDRVWADGLVDRLAAPISLGRIDLRPSASVVVVPIRRDDPPPAWGGAGQLDAIELLVARARARGRERVEVVGPLAPDLDPSGSMGRRLVDAVDAGEIVAHYQPVVDLGSDRVAGAEALARWVGPDPGLTDPLEFLELANLLGLMPRITDGILTQVCTEFATGVPAERGWWVAVNLGVDEATSPEVAGRIQRALDASGLDPERLVIEVSERIVPDPAAMRSLAAIAELGVRLAIDDFGSGWSSLAQLRSLPLDLVKIDRSLVSVSTAQEACLLMATTSMAEALGLQVLAEGVETGEDFLLARIAEIDLGQGFLWGAAVPIDELISRWGDGQAPARSHPPELA